MQVASFLQDDGTLKLASDRLGKAVLDALVSFTTGRCRNSLLCDGLTAALPPTRAPSQSQMFDTMDSIASVCNHSSFSTRSLSSVASCRV